MTHFFVLFCFVQQTTWISHKAHGVNRLSMCIGSNQQASKACVVTIECEFVRCLFHTLTQRNIKQLSSTHQLVGKVSKTRKERQLHQKSQVIQMPTAATASAWQNTGAAPLLVLYLLFFFPVCAAFLLREKVF